MTEKTIKSANRVKDLGEVFTPKKIVNLMLNQPEITAKINDLHATFLEPSAGEGAFLVELLKRKLNVAKAQSKNVKEMQNNFLLALSTLYGIELMEDNVEMLVMNMSNAFQQIYYHTFDLQDQDIRVIKSANVIISANMAQGNALTHKTDTGDPIVFSEWKPVSRGKVQRTEYTFDSIIENGESIGAVQPEYEQMDLFADPEEDTSESQAKEYLPCKWEDIYKRKIK
ncbi:N-6 DNA methylase [Streptococcus orisratti]|uniref:N-6 DNA methylase n=1 Tax=Streptococcus orisratti TaxID=114652 RepID=UPI0023F84B7A|nr:N-6 DNA methylase [Streptococcus orisratti]